MPEMPMEPGRPLSPMRRMEMLVDRFGAFEALAYASIKLARHEPPHERAMDPLVAHSVLEFGDDLRDAAGAATGWKTATRADSGSEIRPLTHP